MQDSVTNERPQAVQYVRMSTDLQAYSIDNQLEAISLYAATNAFEIVGTYADEGKSGLTLRERPALCRLLNDVKNPDRRFSIILVLDVSRWGRFQDPDQSAAYEYFCRAAGVRVEYVAEGFANDGSIGATIIKHLKRVMAAEYSRELSNKVTEAVKALARKGLRQGGTPSYGIRRLLLDDEGKVRMEMTAGSRKYVKSDRVIVVPGPDDEQVVVRDIFHRFANEGLRMAEIARTLNAAGVLALNGGQWTDVSVKRVLTNPLLNGDCVYNRTTRRLGSRKRRNPQSDWITTKVLDPIVPSALFAKAQEFMTQPYSNKIPTDVLLDGLRRMLIIHGKLSFRIIQQAADLPSAWTYFERFGSLKIAFQAVGYQPERRPYRRPLRSKFPDEFLFNGLRRVYDEHGWISGALIDGTTGLPSQRHYRGRFGDLATACSLAGVPYSRRDSQSRGIIASASFSRSRRGPL